MRETAVGSYTRETHNAGLYKCKRQGDQGNRSGNASRNVVNVIQEFLGRVRLSSDGSSCGEGPA